MVQTCMFLVEFRSRFLLGQKAYLLVCYYVSFRESCFFGLDLQANPTIIIICLYPKNPVLWKHQTIKQPVFPRENISPLLCQVTLWYWDAETQTVNLAKVLTEKAHGTSYGSVPRSPRSHAPEGDFLTRPDDGSMGLVYILTGNG